MPCVLMGRRFERAERERIARRILTARLDESSRALASELGVGPETVKAVRSGRRWVDVCQELPRIQRSSLIASGMYSVERRYEIVRRVLTAGEHETLRDLARELGCSREMVRTVQLGRRWADVLPELPRHGGMVSGAWRTCSHLDTKRVACSLGIPESTIEGQFNHRWCAVCPSHSEAL